MIESTLKLKDDRTLGYGIYGNPKGHPIIDFHGIPGSRREAALIQSYVGRADICFIGFDRPGYGRSSPKRNFKVTDLPEDVAALADHLRIARFVALGYSGGGPFALACAALIPERISAVGIISGVGPSNIGSNGMHAANRQKFNLARRMPWITRGLLWVAFSGLRRDPERLARQLKSIWQQMPEPDRLVLQQDQRFADSILEITRDAIVNRVTGWVNEEVLVAQPWQFDLKDVHHPQIFLWHGEKDRNVPVAMGRAVAAQLANCQATFLENEAHISTLYQHGKTIVDVLIRAGNP